MKHRAYVLSLILHGVLLTLMLVNFNFSREYSKPPSVILQIDLNKIQISNKTNLPQKVIPIKTESPKKISKSTENPPPKKVAIKTQNKVQSKSQEKKYPRPKSSELIKNQVSLKESIKKNVEPIPKIEKITEMKTKEDDLQSLLATVEKVRQQPLRQNEILQNDLAADIGNSGLEGRLDQILTISEKDFISSKLRECWNIDGGAQDLEEIMVEVRALISKDGAVRDVQILNRQNYPAFQSVADSAKRAVYICGSKGEESPFYILSQKYDNHYNDWKEIYLRFSPLKGVY